MTAAQRLINVLEEGRTSFESVMDSRADQLRRLLEHLHGRILVLMTQREGAVDEATIVDLTSAIESEIDRLGLRAWAKGSIRDGATAGFEQQARVIMASLGANKWESVNIPLLRESFFQFEKEGLKQIVISSAPTSFRYKWARSLGTQVLEPIRKGVQQRLTDAQIAGMTWRDVASQITDATGLLDLKIQTPENVARTYARTAMNQVFNETGIRAATDAGIEKFENIGIGDERQTEICRFADQQNPMSLQDWNSLNYDGVTVGVPPRHFNCRSSLVPVLPQVEDIDWDKINAEALEVQ